MLRWVDKCKHRKRQKKNSQLLIFSCAAYHNRHNNDRRRKTSLTKYLPLTLLQGFEKGYSSFACEWELEIEHNCNILTPNSWPSALCLSCSPDAQPEVLGSTLLRAGFLYCILSASSLDPNSIRAPEGPLDRVCLSLLPLVYLRLQLYCNCRRTQLSYILVPRPLDRPLDLWNRMFNRHQAEITVMQFRGHSLLVRQSMRVSWDFFYLVPFHQPISADAISSHNCH